RGGRCEGRSAAHRDGGRGAGGRRYLSRRRPADHRGGGSPGGSGTNRAARDVISIILYSRPGCHLCDEMKAVVNRVARHTPIALTEIDITGDPDLEARYGIEVPVLMLEGKKVAKYRIGEGELRRILAARSDEVG